MESRLSQIIYTKKIMIIFLNKNYGNKIKQPNLSNLI